MNFTAWFYSLLIDAIIVMYSLY